MAVDTGLFHNARKVLSQCDSSIFVMRSSEINQYLDRVFTSKSFETRKLFKTSKKKFGKHPKVFKLSKFGRSSIQPDLRRLLEAGIYKLWVDLVEGLNVIPVNMGMTMFHPQKISTNIASVFIMVAALEGSIIMVIFTVEILMGNRTRLYQILCWNVMKFRKTVRNSIT